MEKLREKQRDEAPHLHARLTALADAFWQTARTGQAETLRGGRIYCNAVSLQVYVNETQRARIRRALELLFQVQFSDADLLWTGQRGHGRGMVIFRLTRPFDCALEMTRTVQPNPACEAGTRTAEPTLEEHLTEYRPCGTYEEFRLLAYSQSGWQAYLTAAEDHLQYASLRDLLARVPDRAAILDMVSAIIIAADDRPRLGLAPGQACAQRAPRGIRIRDNAKD